MAEALDDDAVTELKPSDVFEATCVPLMYNRIVFALYTTATCVQDEVVVKLPLEIFTRVLLLATAACNVLALMRNPNPLSAPPKSNSNRLLLVVVGLIHMATVRCVYGPLLGNPPPELLFTIANPFPGGAVLGSDSEWVPSCLSEELKLVLVPFNERFAFPFASVKELLSLQLA